MTKFLLAYTATASAAEEMQNGDPAGAQEEMDKWTAWAARCGEHLVDFGTPLGHAQTVSIAGAGPASASAIITGYSLLEADSMDAAVALLAGHPYFATPGYAIHAYESMPM